MSILSESAKRKYEKYGKLYAESLNHELLDGKIYLMSPRPSFKHDAVAFSLRRILDRHLKGKKCKVIGEVDVYLSKKDRPIPDVMIVCDPKIIKPNGIFGAPDLVVEILSKSSAKKDRGYKKLLYEKYGVKEYWLVDLDGESIEVYHLKDEKYVYAGTYVAPDEDLPQEMKDALRSTFSVSIFDDLTIDLAEIFEDNFVFEDED